LSVDGQGRRVLQVLQPEDGGVAQHVLDLSLGLSERGWEVEVAAPARCTALPRLRAAGVPVYTVPLVRAPARADARALRALRALDGARRYELVHAHSSKAGAIARAALGPARRLVYTPHCFAFSFTADLRVVERAAYWAVEQLLIPRTAALIAVSEWEAEQASRALAGARSRVVTIHNGTAPCAGADPDPALRAFADDAPLAVLVSKLRPEKDPLALVRAAAALHAAGELSGRVAIVGDGELAAAVQEEIADSDLGEVVRWFPFGGAAAPYLAAADLLVVPSHWESLPITPLQAMACGVPVLATAVGGMPELLTDRVTGRLVPAGDGDALASALAELLADRGSLELIGAAGRDVIDRRFRLDTMIDRIALRYRELLERASARHH
jgi:glycosyltransferase involved in cell wall biosynthesis